jgi:predicted negative regulator of RcsB-dependent stress response
MSTTSGNNSKNTILGVAIGVIVLLLGINGYMIYNRSQLKAENTEISADLEETTKLKEELNKQYYSALSELEGMRGTNEELNALNLRAAIALTRGGGWHERRLCLQLHKLLGLP